MWGHQLMWRRDSSRRYFLDRISLFSTIPTSKVTEFTSAEHF